MSVVHQNQHRLYSPWDPSVQNSDVQCTPSTPGSLSSSMIYDVDTQLTYLYQVRISPVFLCNYFLISNQEEHSFSCEDWDDSGEDEEPQFPDDDQDQDNDSLVGEETAFVQELEEIIEELNKEKSEILDGFS